MDSKDSIEHEQMLTNTPRVSKGRWGGAKCSYERFERRERKDICGKFHNVEVLEMKERTN